MKYLWINPAPQKVMHELYTENYKTSVKEIKEDLNKWIDILCLLAGRHGIVRMSILSTLFYIYNAISNQLAAVISCKN